ncbi:MAG: hypothetical protein KJ607_08730 [Bacteroidetes bacterium]|nr:hypothetical protein [Bacteroidota bacterium]
MIPLKLTIEGLYSYQKRQTIDFGTLTCAGLFGIFGQVGSGKSTILEAITFVLYGKTDRLNLSGDNRNYNMMNLRSDELFIEFIFTSGKSNVKYMATAKSRRNSKKFEDVKTIERAAYREEKGEWVPLEPEAMENIIGLSYDNFRRTIIIPQGKFQEFLQLGSKDRTQMMKELFGLGKFELFYKVTALESGNNEKRQNLEGQLQQLGEIRPELITELKERLEALQNSIVGLTKELDIKRKEEADHSRLKELSEKRAEADKNREKLLSIQPEITKKENEIQEFEHCHLNFKSLFDARDESDRKLAALQELLSMEKQEFDDISRKIADKQKELMELKTGYDNRERILKEAEDLEKIAMITKISSEMAGLDIRMQKGEAKSRENLIRIDSLQAEHKQVANSLKELKAQIPDLAELSEIREWHTVNKSLTGIIKDINSDISLVRKEKQEILTLLQAQFSSELFTGMEETDKPGMGITWIEQRIEIKKQAIEKIDAEIEQLSVRAKLEQYASALQKGEPCPLCGSKEHPAILDIENVSEALSENRTKRKNLESGVQELEKLLNKLAGMNQKMTGNREQAEKLEVKLRDAQYKSGLHTGAFRWQKYRSEEELAAAYDRAEKLKAEVLTAEKKLDGIREFMEEETGNKEKFGETLGLLKRQKAELHSRSELLKEQLELLNYSKFENSDANYIISLSTQKKESVKALTDSYERSVQQIADMEKRSDVLNGKTEANTRAFNEERCALDRITKNIAGRLRESPYQNIETVEEILSRDFDAEKERKTVNEYRQSVMAVEAQIKSLSDQIGGRQYSKDAHEDVVKQVSELSESSGQLSREAGKTESEINKLSLDLVKQSGLRKELEAVLLRAEDIKTLKNLFKGSGFVNFVSSVHLQNLCDNANERFHSLTRRRLSLEISDDNSFLVRDFMNGGKVRHIKTLSGGQTFQAALSLALALADSIRTVAGSEKNFFFLDEGFGSLDKESLITVFDTLKSLRNENRVVGVISHVEELRQEIDVNLLITNDEETGSIIHCSWMYT